mmetsp:Transcript_39826/g.71612  ORF Transcript_39826/g.71612 Transcript_39826/m.71612 type:complete len:607 (-) Transcript_39826:156-1976(-)|eukprot:CAMPEP_0197662160 /NCGR_PEP_ID=MMETSP1338-20131121/52324_1 /TAXON_ID=43686 ORGANISM="Pelagodinium beii, Strain RCC1491" /NCGR_SAMPLE_ID=MMETSP1338 /ASSEMBLY_ACC=CAM_ASM_000754 /LENGTH=606 /DNA_ID=CAMNT_0043239885 /DNA_START=63 /DNA_END=1883 /DNA_ORIENTATION=+
MSDERLSNSCLSKIKKELVDNVCRNSHNVLSKDLRAHKLSQLESSVVLMKDGRTKEKLTEFIHDQQSRFAVADVIMDTTMRHVSDETERVIAAVSEVKELLKQSQVLPATTHAADPSRIVPTPVRATSKQPSSRPVIGVGLQKTAPGGQSDTVTDKAIDQYLGKCRRTSHKYTMQGEKIAKFFRTESANSASIPWHHTWGPEPTVGPSAVGETIGGGEEVPTKRRRRQSDADMVDAGCGVDGKTPDLAPATPASTVPGSPEELRAAGIELATEEPKSSVTLTGLSNLDKPLAIGAGNNGLSNLGNTCWAASVLQLLQTCWHDDRHLCANSEDCWTCAVFRVLRPLRADDPVSTSVAFEELCTRVFETWPADFRAREQADAHEFLIKLLSKCMGVNKTFQGEKEIKVTCSACGSCNVKRHAFIVHHVNLAKADSLHKAMEHGTRDTIDDYRCGTCNCQTQAVKTTLFATLPDTMLIALDRFKEDGTKLRRRIHHPCCLNVQQYITDQKPRDADSWNYKLTGAVVHDGKGIGGGHYRCCSNNYMDIAMGGATSWRIHDDGISTDTTWQTVHSQCAYILSYKREAAATPTTPQMLDTQAIQDHTDSIGF